MEVTWCAQCDRYLKGTQWWKAELESRSQHEAIVRLNVRLPRPFFRFLLRYQSHIRILEPASLDAEFRAFAREVLAKYRRGDG